MTTSADNAFLAGVHVAKTAGSTLSEHARAHLGEPAFYRYCRFSRTKRFWSGTPQYEELPEQEKSRIRLIYGHGVCFNVVSLQERIPEFFIAIRHPVPFFHSRYAHESKSHASRLTELPFDAFLKKEKQNHFSWFLVTFFGNLAEFGDEISYRNSISILRNFKYIFATEHVDDQSLALWNALGLPSGMERKRVAKDKAPLPISDDAISAMHQVDLELYNDIASLRVEDVDQNGALNPFGYEPDRYFGNVAAMREPSYLDREAHITAAYRELVNQLFLEFDLEAALARMRQPAPHVDCPDVLSKMMARKHEQFNARYNDKQREMSRRNAEAYRTSGAVV
jgi:hypothetical protein